MQWHLGYRVGGTSGHLSPCFLDREAMRHILNIHLKGKGLKCKRLVSNTVMPQEDAVHHVKYRTLIHKHRNKVIYKEKNH